MSSWNGPFLLLPCHQPPVPISGVIGWRACETGWTADKGTRVPVPSRFLPA